MNKTIEAYKSNMKVAHEDITALIGVYNDALDFIEEKGLSNDFVLFHSHRELYRAKQELGEGKEDAKTSGNSEFK